MKVLALLCLLLTILAIVGFGLMYLLGFAMSFDAPGSDRDLNAWSFRLLLLAPLVIFLALFVFSLRAFTAGNYKRAAVLGAVTPAVSLGLLGALSLSSVASYKAYQQEENERKALEAKYPVQHFTRPAEGGTDTLIVWPSGIVAYRLYMGPDKPVWGGPFGELSEDRGTILYQPSRDNKLQPADLSDFVNEQGQAVTTFYKVATQGGEF